MISIFLMSIVILVLVILKGYKQIKNLIEEIVKAKKAKEREPMTAKIEDVAKATAQYLNFAEETAEPIYQGHRFIDFTLLGSLFKLLSIIFLFLSNEFNSLFNSSISFLFFLTVLSQGKQLNPS